MTVAAAFPEVEGFKEADKVREKVWGQVLAAGRLPPELIHKGGEVPQPGYGSRSRSQ